MAAVKQEMDVVLKLNDQFSSGLKNIQKETSNTFDEKKPGSFLSGIKASSVALGALAVGGIVAVGAGLTSAFNKAREFEQSMANVKAITGATGEDFEKLSQLAKEMGATTAHSATAAAEGIQFLGMAGLDTNQIMDALPGTLALASAAGMELGAAADISTNILSGMGMSISELDGVVDKLAQTGRIANTDVLQLGEAFKMVGPTAAASGVSFDDAAVSLGMLANASMSGSIGGSSLNSALRAMINPSKEAEREAKKLGLTFVDTRGKMLPMENILGQLEERSVSTKQSFKLFGTEGARAMNAMRNQGTAAFRALDKKIKESGGVAEDMAKARLGSFDGAVKMLESAFSAFAITIGENFLPIATAIINDFLLPAITKTNEFVEAVGGFGQMWKDVLTMIVGFKNSALNILEELFTNTDFAGAFLTNIGEMLLTVPRMFFHMAYGSTGFGGIFGIVRELGKILWAPLERGFVILWDLIKGPMIAGINFIQEAVVEGANAMIRQFNNIGDAFGLTIDTIDFTPLTVGPAKSMQEHWDIAEQQVGDSISNIGLISDDIGEAIKGDFNKATQAIKDTAALVAPHLDENLKEMIDKYDDATGKMANESKEKGKDIGEALGQGIDEEMDKAADKASKVFLGGFGAEMMNPQSGPGKLVANGLSSAIESGDFKTAMAGVAQGMATMIGGPIAGAVAGQLISAVIKSGPSAAVRASGAFGNILRGFEAAGGDIRATGGLQGQLEGLMTRKGKFTQLAGIRDLVGQLEGFGLSKDRAADVVAILSRLRGAGEFKEDLPEEVFERVNVALREALIQQEIADIIGQRRQMGFETGVTRTAEKRISGSFAKLQLGDLFAAQHGYSGMVSQPTLFLAGEAGPEMVDIAPTGRMSGGFQGSGGQSFHFNFAVNTIDEQGVKAFIEEDARPFIVQMLQRESTRGASVMYQSGITTDPSV